MSSLNTFPSPLAYTDQLPTPQTCQTCSHLKASPLSTPAFFPALLRMHFLKLTSSKRSLYESHFIKMAIFNHFILTAILPTQSSTLSSLNQLYFSSVHHLPLCYLLICSLSISSTRISIGTKEFIFFTTQSQAL